MLYMNNKDEALLKEVLHVLKHPNALSSVQREKNESVIKSFEVLLKDSSEYSQERRSKAQAMVEAKRKIDKKYATPRARH